MPRPRFYKLPEEKRLRIMENAAREFSARGYDNASFNQILENAEVSKGAAYYYFDDKADLFLSVLDFYVPHLLSFIMTEPETLTAENFWENVLAIYRAPFLEGVNMPWAFGTLRAMISLTPGTSSHPVLQGYVDKLRGWMVKMLHRGQQLGVVRADMPDELLLAMLNGMDRGSDDWFIEHWDTLTRDEIAALTLRVGDIVRRAFSP